MEDEHFLLAFDELAKLRVGLVGALHTSLLHTVQDDDDHGTTNVLCYGCFAFSDKLLHSASRSLGRSLRRNDACSAALSFSVRLVVVLFSSLTSEFFRILRTATFAIHQCRHV